MLFVWPLGHLSLGSAIVVSLNLHGPSGNILEKPLTTVSNPYDCVTQRWQVYLMTFTNLLSFSLGFHSEWLKRGKRVPIFQSHYYNLHANYSVFHRKHRPDRYSSFSKFIFLETLRATGCAKKLWGDLYVTWNYDMELLQHGSCFVWCRNWCSFTWG